MSQQRQTLIICVLFEIVFSGIVYFINNEVLDSSYFLDTYTESNTYDVFEDGSFYRVLHDGYAYWPSNSPYAKDIRGVSFYNSLYNYETEEYISRFKSTWSMPSLNGQDIAYSLLSPKYWVTSTFTYEAPYGFEMIAQYGDKIFFENKNHVELGYGLEKVINSEEVRKLPYLAQDLIMQEYIVSENATNTHADMNHLIQYVNTFTFEKDCEWWDSVWDTMLVFENQNRNDIQVDLYYEGKHLKTYTYYGQHYFIIPLHETYYVSDIRLTNLSGNEAIINYFHMNSTAFEQLYEVRKENAFYDTKLSNNKVEANISLKKSMKIYTSIPYDVGWKVFVDGIEVEYEKVNFGFIGFDAGPGNHKVLFEYEIPMLNAGMHLSGVSFLLLVILWRKRYV